MKVFGHIHLKGVTVANNYMKFLFSQSLHRFLRKHKHTYAHLSRRQQFSKSISLVFWDTSNSIFSGCPVKSQGVRSLKKWTFSKRLKTCKRYISLYQINFWNTFISVADTSISCEWLKDILLVIIVYGKSIVWMCVDGILF